MNPTRIFIFVVSFFYVALVQGTANLTQVRSTEKIRWVRPTEFLGDLEPVGTEGLAKVYICRAFNNGRWMPGRLLVGDNIECRIPQANDEEIVQSFEILVWPRGTVTWTKVVFPALPCNPIDNGLTICRGFYTSDLVVGIYYTPSEPGCFFFHGTLLQVTYDFEVLAKSAYGVLTNA